MALYFHYKILIIFMHLGTENANGAQEQQKCLILLNFSDVHVS